MRRLLIVLLLALAPSLALANGNVCTCTGACGLNAGTGWTGAASCTDAGGPDPGAGIDDAIVVANGGSLSWDQTGTRVYKYLWTQPGGTTTVTVSPVVMQFDGPPLIFSFVEAFFAVGNDNDARGTFVSNGKDLTISWIGAGAGVKMILAPGPFGGTQDNGTNYTNVTMRGVVRASTFVTNYSKGATAPTPDTNMVDCFNGAVAPGPGAAGDTVVFTSGKSKDFWYEVTCYPSQCTGVGGCCSAASATTECSATACNGGPCDYQVTRNSTGSTPGSVASSTSWSSMTMVAGVGGPQRHKTPVDDDANGTANGDGTMPAVGDSFVVFKPVLIQGGTNPILNGIQTWFLGSNVDWRYVEVNKGSGQTAETCNGGEGGTVFWDVATKIGSAEGAMEFVNLHNFASRQGTWEVSQTDRTDDQRPNVPRVYDHFYIHDVDATVGTTCVAADAQTTMAEGIVYFMDQSDGTQNGITMDGFHIARWGTGRAIGITGGGVTISNVLWKNLIIHDFPGIPSYGIGGQALKFAKGSVDVDGVAVWDLGATSRGANGISSDFTASSSFAVRNGFFVNIDANVLGASDNSALGGLMVAGAIAQNTSGALISNSYAARIVGATYGGRYLFNFFKDFNMEDDNTAPCNSTDARGAVHAPVEMIGNFITRAHPLSCTENGVMIKLQNASAFTNQTRRIVSNVFFNMDTDATSNLNGLFTADQGQGITRDIDFYNNVVDLNGNAGSTQSIGLFLSSPTTHKTTIYYNIFTGLNLANSWGFHTGTNTRDEGYNRFSRVTNSPPINGAAPAASDVDSDADSDLFIDKANLRYGAPCWSPEFKRNPWGGPVGPLRFGIQSFSSFHPAVLPLMDADAFKSYDWRACQRTYQDTIYR